MKVMANNKLFILSLLAVLFILIIHPQHFVSPGVYSFVDLFRFIELGISCVCFFFFYFLFLRNSGYASEFYYGNVEKNKKDNKFYCWLMFFTGVIILILNVHYLNIYNKTKNDIRNSLKVWEISAYLVTTIYSVWFWFSKDRGRLIIKKFTEEEKLPTFFIILLSNFIIILIAFLHSIIYIGNFIFNDTLVKIIEKNHTLLSLFLINIVYYFFCKINNKVINNLPDSDDAKKEFNIMLKYVDRPTFIIFFILLLLLGYTRLIGCNSEMDNFVSGAIAFELLLSSIVWANTNTA